MKDKMHLRKLLVYKDPTHSEYVNCGEEKTTSESISSWKQNKNTRIYLISLLSYRFPRSGA